MGNFLDRIWHAARMDERRCVFCHAPFSPEPGGSVTELAGGGRLGTSEALCPVCEAKFRRRNTGYCPGCGRLLDIPDIALCGECLLTPPPWSHFCFFGVYGGAMRDLMLRAKFFADFGALELFGELLAAVCRNLFCPANQASGIDAVVPVPLHESRLRERGLNQSLELARPVSVVLHAPLRPDWLTRRVATPHQMGKNRKERLAALVGAFEGTPAVAGKRILLVDDIATTGTTLRRASLALLEAGAESVAAAVVLRA